MTSPPNTLFHSLLLFNAGVNMEMEPILLPNNQLAEGENITIRGNLARTRPPFNDLAATGNFDVGLFQGGCFYKKDDGTIGIVVQVSGRLFMCDIVGSAFTVTEVTIAGDPNSAVLPQAWLWQSEKWVCVNNGVAATIFLNVNTGVAVRSAGSSYTVIATIQNAAVIPIAGGTVDLTLTAPYTGSFNIYVIIRSSALGTPILGVFQPVPGGDLTVVNIRATPGVTIPANSTVEVAGVIQLPVGKMGAYIMGRNWVALPDGRSFMGGDLTGSSSGTQAEAYRDAVLSASHNAYLVGSGNFILPGQYGDVTAFGFAVTLDAPLGQGPLQVFTPSNVFSCLAPTDDTVWSSLNSPILPVGLTGGGATGAWAFSSANGDLPFRSPDGIRSLAIGRRDVGATWNNAPISSEVSPVLDADDANLLQFASQITFNNRTLQTAAPQQTAFGVVHTKLAVINSDSISTLQGKAPAAYDGIWSGRSILQMFIDDKSVNKRAFAVCLSATNTFLITEIMKSGTTPLDNTTQRITQTLVFPVLDFRQKDPQTRDWKRLMAGEFGVKDLIGVVEFTAWFRPDFDPNWHLWRGPWTVDATTGANYRPRMGLGETPSTTDPVTGRACREGYVFHVKLQIVGPCTFTGARFQAAILPIPEIATP